MENMDYVMNELIAQFEAMDPQILAGGIVSLGVIILAVKQNVKMAKLFGKGSGTGIALMFFPGITSLILGMGKAEFQA